MKFSMNGFRRQLSGDVQALRDEVKKIISGEYCDHDDLIEAMNSVITHSNAVNCVYIDGDSDFSEMSDVEIEHIEKEGGDW